MHRGRNYDQLYEFYDLSLISVLFELCLYNDSTQRVLSTTVDDRAAYCKISWNFDTARLDASIILWLWYLLCQSVVIPGATGTSHSFDRLCLPKKNLSWTESFAHPRHIDIVFSLSKQRSHLPKFPGNLMKSHCKRSHRVWCRDIIDQRIQLWNHTY